MRYHPLLWGKLLESKPYFARLWKIPRAILPSLCLFVLCGCDEIATMFQKKKIPLEGERILIHGEMASPRAREPMTSQSLQSSHDCVQQWSQTGLNAAHHLGALTLSGNPAEPMVQIWKRSVSGLAMLPVMPIATVDSIFVVDHKGVLSSWDWDGHKKWSTPTHFRMSVAGMGGGLATDGQKIYVTTPHQWVLCVDCVTGKVLWSHLMAHAARNGPALLNNRVAVLTLANQVVVLDAKTGQELWDNQGARTTTSILGGSTPAMTVDQLVAGTASGEILACALSTGDRLWERTLRSMNKTGEDTNFNYIQAHPVIIGTQVYAISDGGPLVCCDLASGDLLWRQELKGVQTPAVVGNTLFVVTSNGHCVALNRHNGKEFWDVALPENQQWMGPIMAGGLLYVLSNRGEFRALNPLQQGQCLWTMQLGGTYSAPPIVIRDGFLFFSNKGVLSFYRRP